MTLNKKIFQGVFWTSLQTIIEQSISFIVKLILAKLLFPEDFGLVGMAVVFTSFVGVFNDLGIGAALVQRKDVDLRPSHFHTSFWTGVIWAILLYLLISFVVGPLAASFYNKPILADLIPVLSIGILASPVNMVHKAQLIKKLDFKKIAIITNTCNIFSGILSVFLAIFGFGVWSLVFNSVASILIAIPLYFRSTGWLPSLIWERSAFKDIFGFGAYTTGSAVFNNLISKIDYLLIGKFVSASALGYYTFAFVLTDIVRGQIMKVMNKVMYPIYGQKQNNKASLRNYYLKVVRYNSFIVYPIMNIMLLAGGGIITYFFGNKWEGAIMPMKILSVSVMFHMMVNSNTSLIRGLGKPKLELQIQIFKSVFIFIPLIAAGIYFFGINGAAYAVLLNKIVSVIIAQYYLKKLVQIDWFQLKNAIIEPILATIIAISTSLILINFFQIHFILVVGLVILIFLSVYYFMAKDEISALLILFKNAMK